MAHRSGCAFSFIACLPGEPEEGKPVPASTRHLQRDGAQRSVLISVMFESTIENLYFDCLAAVSTPQYCSRSGQARVTSRRPLRPRRRLARLTGLRKLGPELPRRSQPEVGVVGQQGRALACTFTKVPFGPRLQPPCYAPEQVRTVRRWRVFAKQFAVAGLQLFHRELPQ